MEIINNSKAFKKGGRRINSININNSYLFNQKEYRTISTLTNLLKCSRTHIYKLIEENKIIIIKC